MTLADRLAAQGRLGLDLLERFGDDLLEIIAYLESEGIPHRDIKPDNLGVRPRRGDRSLHLVLFDFSLARTPDTASRPARRATSTRSSASGPAGGGIRPQTATPPPPPSTRWRPAPGRCGATGAPTRSTSTTRCLASTASCSTRRCGTGCSASSREAFTAACQPVRHRPSRRARRGVPCSPPRARPVTSTEDGQAADAASAGTARRRRQPGDPGAELGLSGAATSALERLGLGTVEQLLTYPTADGTAPQASASRSAARCWRRSVGSGPASTPNPPTRPPASIGSPPSSSPSPPPPRRRPTMTLELLLGLHGERPRLLLAGDGDAAHGPRRWRGPARPTSRPGSISTGPATTPCWSGPGHVGASSQPSPRSAAS